MMLFLEVEDNWLRHNRRNRKEGMLPDTRMPDLMME